MGKRHEQKHLTEDEVEKLKAACDTFSDQLIVYGLLYTGMRGDELCHMHPGYCNYLDYLCSNLIMFRLSRK